MPAGALHSELALRSADGVRLSGHRWVPDGGDVVAELLVVHGYAEHGGRYRELASELAAGGIATTAIDLRGHGRSSGPRGFVRQFDDYHHDLRAALAVAADSPRFVLGHSLGGLIVLDFVTRSAGARELAGLVIVSPYLAPAMQMPLSRLVGGLAGELWPRLVVPNGLDPAGLSRDRAAVDAYRRDPLVFGHATVGWYRATMTAQHRVTAVSAVDLPLLYYFSDSDPVASGLVSRAFVEALSCPDKSVRPRRWASHEILNEVDRHEVHTEIREWIVAHARAMRGGAGERSVEAER